MSKNNENKLVPRLRFPEFVDSGEWVFEPFHKVYSFLVTNSFSREFLNYENGSVKNIHYGDIHTKFSTHFDITKEVVPFVNPDVSIDKIREECYCIEGDIIFADASEDLNDVGKSIEIINLNGEKLLSGLHTLMARQIEKKLEIGFGGYLFKSDRIRKQIQREAQGAKVLGISGTRISNIKIYYPKNPQEQQKIAACLSSLDEVITAESQKLELLKEHKKGLLQNLFPQEGETVPKLRFPEFVDSGEWEEKKLGEIAEFLKGKGISKADVDAKGKQPCIRYGELYTHYGEVIKEIKSFTNLMEDDLMLSEPNDVIIPSSGETKVDIATASCVKLGGVALGGDLNILRTSLNGDFLAYYLSHGLKKAISKIAQGDAVVHLYATQLKKLTIRVPLKKKEQERIASVLSSIDELINAQRQKIELLQQHKKGLLQGLFPNLHDGYDG